MTENNGYTDEATETSPLLPSAKSSSIIDNEAEISHLRETIELPDIAGESPYEEVAANVSNQDNPMLPCLTFRSCVLGLLFTCILAFVNQFFTYRTIPIFLSMIVAQLLSYPMGKAMALILPRRTHVLFGGRWQFSFNPGPFSVKEHCIISIMANAASGTSMAIQVITIQRIFYKHSVGYIISLLFVLSSHTIGYGMAGIMRKFVVRPAAMIWPGNLPTCALFRVLHDDENEERQNNETNMTTASRRMSRVHFFYMIFFFQFLWYWIPGYICPVLSLFSLLCYIDPTNIVLSQVTGANGLGLGSFELDWNAWISFVDSPIVVPFWAQLNILLGFVVLVWIITPAAYYTNLWNSKAMPIVSNQVFTIEGYLYNVSAVLDSNLRLNETAYNIYGQPRITAIFAFNYAIGFAGTTCILVHTCLNEGKDIFNRFRSSISDVVDDIHGTLMAQYPEAPEWWYTVVFIVGFTIALIVCQVGGFMPWYMLFLAVIIGFIFLLPNAIMQAVANITMGLNVITEFIAGMIMPGDPIANVTFKTYAYITQVQGLFFLSDLKLGHYMKIPPRIMFMTQIVATVVAGIVNFVTAIYLIETIPNICTEKNIEWRCPISTTFYSASIIWGAIGPLKIFGSNSVYWPLLFGFLIGALLPVPVWMLRKKYPDTKWLQYVHFPIILSATSAIPTAPPGEYPSWLIVGFLFNFVLYRYARDWWKRYAFVFSASMSCGVVVSALLIFFALTNNNVNFPTWWGTGGITGDGCPLASANFSGIMPDYKPLL
ncbi:unnamed protein product [Rotaria magnacalcarata]|uniref:Oligopeptide transporter n=2 Tax=Rotaria magnacalcarata TaxID=392030 RepID=A0A815S2X2_9BILA|nr:unnamed protein product [Rotaria magnacalcarata]